MSTESEINEAALNFLPKLQARQPGSSASQVNQNRLHGVGKTMELGEVENFIMTHFDEDDYSTKTKFIDIDGKLVGLDISDFSSFREVVYGLMEFQFFQERIDHESLLDYSYDWLISSYKTEGIVLLLVDYLKDRITVETKEYHFYFVVKGLAIEKPIKIGQSWVTYFSNEKIRGYYDQFRAKKPDKSYNEFYEIYKSHFDSINIHTVVKGVISRALEVARWEATLAVDVLKCFCSSYSTEKLVRMFDIDFVFAQDGISQTMFMPQTDFIEATLQTTRLHGIIPIELKNQTVEEMFSKGMNLYSLFISKKYNSDLYIETEALIRQLGNICSTANNYEKVVKSISLFEGFCVPKGSGRSKGESIIKNKVVPKVVCAVEVEVIQKLVRIFYETRDKYLHNAIRIPIRKSELNRFIAFQRVFIQKLICLNGSYQTVEQVLHFFEII
ncbi:MAG TPA: hypothetical protein VFE32_03825 [Puia sp.]|jgi:hypothetical protein|nr:hypothetical protein [Puia sp.]